MSLNLVNYSDSSSDEEIEERKTQPVPKRKLPNPFEKSHQTQRELEDDTTEHNGRTRNFPHERGNWVTYVYIECPKSDAIDTLQNELLDVINATKAFDTVEFHSIEDLHISVTRTVVLRHHWIDEFVRSIENSLKNAHKFWILLNSINVYCNDNQTRTFISLSMADMPAATKQSLSFIVDKMNSCLEEFKLTPFYEEASFHVSLLWCLGDRRDELMTLLPEFCKKFEHSSSSAMDDLSFAIHVEQLFCKIGNKLYKFQL